MRQTRSRTTITSQRSDPYKTLGKKPTEITMENEELAKHQIYLSTSEEMQRSAQAVCVEGETEGKFTCIYAGDGCLADSLFIPAVMHRQVQKGNVYLVVNPDDYTAGYYDALGDKGGQP